MQRGHEDHDHRPWWRAPRTTASGRRAPPRSPPAGSSRRPAPARRSPAGPAARRPPAPRRRGRAQRLPAVAERPRPMRFLIIASVRSCPRPGASSGAPRAGRVVAGARSTILVPGRTRRGDAAAGRPGRPETASRRPSPCRQSPRFRPFEDALDPDAALAVLREATAGADDGELFLERRRSESLVFDDGRLKNAGYDAAEGFGLRAVRGETAGYAHSTEISRGRAEARRRDRAARRRRRRRHASPPRRSRPTSASTPTATPSTTPSSR